MYDYMKALQERFDKKPPERLVRAVQSAREEVREGMDDEKRKKLLRLLDAQNILLWDSAPQTITQLTAALREETRWEKHTVITMLSRLEAKGAVRHEEGARAKKFYPTVKQGDAARAETESFLGKVYGGSLGLMMSAMVEGCALTREDIDELSAILEQAGGNSK